LLLTQENVTHRGRFHAILDTTSLPRPTQKPRPKFYIAAQNTADSFVFAGRMGHSIMAIPLTGAAIDYGDPVDWGGDAPVVAHLPRCLDGGRPSW
jgi:alkanesulfonate monooxygenase SsuD/methylene tetrahydromethanopterin reductase-like flavin-dependent oxidoreductase (luciferase family)